MLELISYEMQWENLKTSGRHFQVGINLDLGHPPAKTSVNSFYTLRQSYEGFFIIEMQLLLTEKRPWDFRCVTKNSVIVPL